MHREERTIFGLERRFCLAVEATRLSVCVRHWLCLDGRSTRSRLIWPCFPCSCRGLLLRRGLASRSLLLLLLRTAERVLHLQMEP